MAAQPLLQAWRARPWNRPAGPPDRPKAGHPSGKDDPKAVLRRSLLASPRLFYDRHFLDFFDTRAVYRSDRIRQELGWSPAVSRDQALRTTRQWIQDFLSPGRANASAGADTPDHDG
jgi:hypothetical protein